MADKYFEANVFGAPYSEDDGWWVTVYPLEMQGDYLTARTDQPLSTVPLSEADMEAIGTIDGDDWYGTDNGTMPARLGEILAPVFERLRSE